MKSAIALIALGALALILLVENVEGFTEGTQSMRGKQTETEYRKQLLEEDTDSQTTSTVVSELSLSSSSSSSAQLGACKNFSVFAGTAILFDGGVTTIYTGNIGVSPGTSITGNYAVKKGSVEVNTGDASNCAADQLSAYNFFNDKVCTDSLASNDLAGLTLSPGVYCTDSAKFVISASTVTLDGQGDSNAEFIFQTDETVITGTGISFILINGAKAANVYWKVGTALTVGTSSSFIGNVLAGTAISIDSSATAQGRLLAQAEVTFEGSGKVSQDAIPITPAGSSSSASLSGISAMALITLVVTTLALL